MEQLSTAIIELISKRYETTPSLTFLHTTLFVGDLNVNLGWKPIHKTCDMMPGADMSKTTYVSEIPGVENVLVSWTEIVRAEETRTVDIVLIHPVDVETGQIISDLLGLAEEHSVGDDSLEEQPNVLYRLSLQEGEVVLIPLEQTQVSIDMEDFYTDEILTGLSGLCRKIEEDDSGLSIICGPRGTGKTKMLDIIPDMVSKTCIFITNNMLEITFNSPVFSDILEQIINPVLILDDIENHLKIELSDQSVLTNNILQLLEGPVGQTVHVLLISNSDLKSLDKNIVRSRTLGQVLETSERTVKKHIKGIKQRGIRL